MKEEAGAWIAFSKISRAFGVNRLVMQAPYTAFLVNFEKIVVLAPHKIIIHFGLQSNSIQSNCTIQ